MTWLTELIEFIKGVFTGLTGLFITTDNKKILFIFAIPVVFVSLVTVILEYVFPLILGGDVVLFRGKKPLRSQFRFGFRQLRSNLAQAKFYGLKGVKKFQFAFFSNSMREFFFKSAEQKKVNSLYASEFKRLYGFMPNKAQLAEFKSMVGVKNIIKNRKQNLNNGNDNIEDDKKDDKKNDNIINLHSA